MGYWDGYPIGDTYDDGDVLVRDEDILMAGYVAEANRLGRLRESGVCIHASAVGVSESGEIYYREQVGLKRGQMACTEHTGGCTAVFDTEDAWHDARLAH